MRKNQLTRNEISLESLAGRIRFARTQKGLTRRELASLLGLTEGAVRFLEDGRSKDLAGRNVLPMADALGVSARWLMTGKS